MKPTNNKKAKAIFKVTKEEVEWTFYQIFKYEIKL